MSKVLITGATGFIGKSLLNYISLSTDFLIEDIVLLSSKPNENYKTIVYSDSNIPQIPEDIKFVIHLGAYTPKEPKLANDIDKCNSNIIFTSKLLAALPSHINRLVFISTLDVYENREVIISETSPLLPSTLYGSSKLYCEKMVQEYCEQRHISSQILRLGHIYGKGEELYKKIIPETIKKVINNEAPIIYSTGHEKRSFLHVDDCAMSIWKSCFSTDERIVNVVSGEAYSILDIVNMIIKISGKNISPSILSKAITTRDYCFDDTLKKELFGENTVSLIEGLEVEYWALNEQ